MYTNGKKCNCIFLRASEQCFITCDLMLELCWIVADNNESNNDTSKATCPLNSIFCIVE